MFDNVARGSQITADVYLRRLGSFCALKSLTPAYLASLPVKEIEALLLDYVTDHTGNAGSYLHSTVKAVKSWVRERIAVVVAAMPEDVAKASSPHSRMAAFLSSTRWVGEVGLEYM